VKADAGDKEDTEEGGPSEGEDDKDETKPKTAVESPPPKERTSESIKNKDDVSRAESTSPPLMDVEQTPQRSNRKSKDQAGESEKSPTSESSKVGPEAEPQEQQKNSNDDPDSRKTMGDQNKSDDGVLTKDNELVGGDDKASSDVADTGKEDAPEKAGAGPEKSDDESTNEINLTQTDPTMNLANKALDDSGSQVREPLGTRVENDSSAPEKVDNTTAIDEPATMNAHDTKDVQEQGAQKELVDEKDTTSGDGTVPDKNTLFEGGIKKVPAKDNRKSDDAAARDGQNLHANEADTLLHEPQSSLGVAIDSGPSVESSESVDKVIENDSTPTDDTKNPKLGVDRSTAAADPKERASLSIDASLDTKVKTVMSVPSTAMESHGVEAATGKSKTDSVLVDKDNSDQVKTVDSPLVAQSVPDETIKESKVDVIKDVVMEDVGSEEVSSDEQSRDAVAHHPNGSESEEVITPLVLSKRRLNLDRARVALFSMGLQIHGRPGYERLFADYWDALSMRISGNLTKSESAACSRVIDSFLKTKKLKKLHNRMIIGTFTVV